MNNAILPSPDKIPHNLSYIPKAMPDEFLGWYEYRFKKINSLEYTNNTFVHGKYGFTLPYKILEYNFFETLNTHQQYQLLTKHTVLGCFLDCDNLNSILAYLKTINDNEPHMVNNEYFYKKTIGTNRESVFSELNFFYKSRVRYCSSCFVDQVKEHGIPWMKLSWFKAINYCEVHKTPLIAPFCETCNELLIGSRMFDSLFSGSCNKCNNIIWNEKDFLPSFPLNIEKKCDVDFFVHRNIDKMLSEYLKNIYDEVISLTNDFTKDIKLTKLQSMAIHCGHSSYSYVLKYIFDGDWGHFIDFFQDKILVAWRKEKICSHRYIYCKYLTTKLDHY